MARRFDPVRDTEVASPERSHKDSTAEDDYHSHRSHSPTESHFGDQPYRDRQPSRSASIAGILNDDDQQPGRSRSHSFGMGAASGSNGGLAPSYLNRVGSSPSSSSIKLPNTTSFSSPHQSPESGMLELREQHRFSPDNYGRPLRRQSSSHSASSSNEYHTYAHNAQKPHASPSMLNMLNSDAPRLIDDNRRPYSSTPSSIDLPPRSRGPSFAGGLAILSPSTEGAANGRVGSGSFLRRDSSNQSPLQRGVAMPSPHQNHHIPKQSSGSSNNPYFAVPDVPTRSPDVLFNRKSLPNVTPSPDLMHTSIPSHHLVTGETDLRDSRGARMHPQHAPLTPIGYGSGSGHLPQHGITPHGALESPGSVTPIHHSAYPQSPMDFPPTPGSYYPPSANFSHLPHPSTPSSAHQRLESERLTEMHNHSVHSQVSRPWIDRERSSSKLSQYSEQSPVMEHSQGGWTSEMPLTEKKEEAETGVPPNKRRKASVSLKADEGVAGESQKVSVHDPGASVPKRGRPKGRKSISKVDVPAKEGRPSIDGKDPILSTKTEKVGDSVSEILKENPRMPVDEDSKTGAKMATPMDSTKSPPMNTIEMSTTPPVPQVVKSAYKPNTRVSVPTTIRLPVTSDQVDKMRFQCRNSLRLKWQEANPSINDGYDIVVSKFAAQITLPSEKSSIGGESALEKKRKRDKAEAEESNARLVAQHYNSRQDQGLGARQQSPILPLRNFNNWIKSVIIGSYAKRNGRVLDLGGGKGGDLNKWDKGQIGEYVLCDIASVSVEQAESRYKERRNRFSAQFFSFDCFSTPLADSIPRSLLDPLFDNVSLQFCLHYGWESVPKAQLMLENIARYLKPGGVFVGTIPNADLLRSKLGTIIESSSSSTAEGDSLTFGNQYYTVRFDADTAKKGKFPPFGHKYYFTLLDAVDDVAEYVVDWDQLISLAQQNGLECIFKKTFDQVWREEGQMGRFRDLARKMRITPDGGPNGIPMNEDLWEATGLYLAFAFEKKSRP